MRILVTGSSGQVGAHLARMLPQAGETVAYDRSALNVADFDALRTAIRDARPDVIVNAAAYTDVDRAETDTLAHDINAVAPGIMAEEAKKLGALLVHYSTDYVFDGRAGRAYVETDATNPLQAYGRTKLEGERAVAAVGGSALVLRCAWIYDSRRRNFVLTMLRLAAERDELRVVNDQFGCPTWARAIADATRALIRHPKAREASGIYHLAGPGRASRYEQAQAVLEAAARKPCLVPVSTAEFPLPAARPADTTLEARKLRDTFGIVMDDWRTQLRACLAGLPATRTEAGVQ